MFRKNSKLTIKLSSLFLALLLCLSLTSCFNFGSSGGNLGPIINGNVNSSQNSEFPELDLIHQLFEQLSVYDLDREVLMTAVLKAYAEATGDVYAAYYTPEELEAVTSDNQGEMQGIGVSVVNDVLDIDGFNYSVLTIISVFQGSPALDAGLRMGDHVYAVTNSEGETHTVQELGYDNAIASIRGVSGTKAAFIVLRPVAGGTYEQLTFEIERKKITTESVTGRVYEADPTIGIIKIAQFDLTTPTQFSATMDSLIEKGCRKFIFDVRYNPGGDLASIEAVLSTFLQKGDVMISTVYKNGTGTSDKVDVVNSHTGAYASCNVSKKDIGKYRDYEFAVLTNEYTASAAELFTSNLRDYELATLVGVTTYGKGCMQSMYDLAYWGVPGALKLTTAWYLPPSGENYHDIGIAPDIEVKLDESLIEEYGNVYLIPDDKDPQLMAAVNALK
jgi:carboxyl-terminal processing protease